MSRTTRSSDVAVSASRLPIATVDLGALELNLQLLARAAGGAKLMAVVKANAYGHGASRCGLRLARCEECSGLAVARVSEALQLREAGVEIPVLVLGGCGQPEDLQLCSAHKIAVVVHDWTHVDLLESVVVTNPLKVWVKLDTGMHRLGFSGHELSFVLERLAAAVTVDEVSCVMTHLANADDLDDETTAKQLAQFQQWTNGWPGERSIANSAGLLGWPGAIGTYVRPGLALYGISPFLEGVGSSLGLRPVMTLRTRLIAIKEVERGARVGYGGTWRAPTRMRIGVAAVGYADGYPRGAVGPAALLVEDSITSVVGRVSMDLTAVDLRSAPEATVGSPVTIWGEGLPVEGLAAATGRIPYELVAGLGRRVEYDYVG